MVLDSLEIGLVAVSGQQKSFDSLSLRSALIFLVDLLFAGSHSTNESILLEMADMNISKLHR